MNRLIAGVFALGLAVAVPGHAQSSGADKLPPVQPPPDMDAPAAKPAEPASRSAPIVPLANSDAEAAAAAEAEAKASAERARQLNSANFTVTPPAPKASDSPGLPADVQKAAEATELPIVTVRQNGYERVEEYRKKGVLYFVRVVPQEGPPRYYVDNVSAIPPDLSSISGPSGVIKPVYYKLLEWK